MQRSPRRTSGATLAALRRATAAEHESVDGSIELDRLVEIEYYAAVVRGLIQAAETVESTLPRIPLRIRREGLSPADVSRRSSIDAEAKFVDELTGPRAPRRRQDIEGSFAGPQGSGAMAGLLYVYVGSALGGLHLLRVVRTAPWWRHDREHVLLQPYGRHLKDRWRSVLTVLEGLDSGEADAAVLAASVGFEVFRRSLADQLAVGGVT